MAFTLSADVKIKNLEDLSVDLEGWHCVNKVIENVFNSLYPVATNSPSDPDPIGELLRKVIGEQEAKVSNLEYEQAKDGVVY